MCQRAAMQGMFAALALSNAPVRTFMLMGFGWGAFNVLLPEIKAGLGLSDAELGLALMCGGIGLLPALVVAPWLDRRLGRLALPLASVAMGAAFVLPPAAPSHAAFAASMLLLGLASGTSDVIMNTRVSEIEAARGRSLMNLNHGMFSVVYVLGAVLAGLGRELGWATAAVPALTPLLALAILPGMVRRLAGRPPGAAVAVPERLRLAGPALWGGLLVMMAFLVESATEAWSALHIERSLGGRAAEGAAGPVVLGLTMAVGRLSGQVLAERLGEARLVGLAFPLAASGLFLAALAGSPPVAYLGFAMAGLGASVVAPTALAMIGRRVTEGGRSRAIAAATVMGFLAFLLGPSLIGIVSQAVGLRAAFAAVAVALLVTPLLLLPLIRVPPADRAAGRAL